MWLLKLVPRYSDRKSCNNKIRSSIYPFSSLWLDVEYLLSIVEWLHLHGKCWEINWAWADSYTNQKRGNVPKIDHVSCNFSPKPYLGYVKVFC